MTLASLKPLFDRLNDKSVIITIHTWSLILVPNIGRAAKTLFATLPIMLFYINFYLIVSACIKNKTCHLLRIDKALSEVKMIKFKPLTNVSVFLIITNLLWHVKLPEWNFNETWDSFGFFMLIYYLCWSFWAALCLVVKITVFVIG